MAIIILNIISFIANVISILNYLFLQKTHKLKVYTIICLINSIFFILRCIICKDYVGTLSEFFWISISIYGLIKYKRNI